MTRMKLPVFALLLLAVLFAGFGAYLWGSRRIAASTDTPDTVLKQKIDRARLIGASPNKVRGFLDQLGIAHGGYHRKSAIPEDDRVLTGCIPDAGSAEDLPIPFGYDLIIEFRFDEQERLWHYSIERRVIAP